MLVGPVPCMLQELVASQVMLLDALLGEFLHHLGLSGDRGVVGARHPTGILTLHTGPAHQNILNGVIQHVSHVEHTSHIGWWNDDGLGLTSVGFAGEKFVVKPVLIPFAFDLFRVVFAC